MMINSAKTKSTSNLFTTPNDRQTKIFRHNPSTSSLLNKLAEGGCLSKAHSKTSLHKWKRVNTTINYDPALSKNIVSLWQQTGKHQMCRLNVPSFAFSLLSSNLPTDTQPSFIHQFNDVKVRGEMILDVS